MAKNDKSRIKQIFNDLENFKNFCRDYGYKFDEVDLYSNRSYVYRQYTKFVAGKEVKDMWEIDAGRR
jgi:hypothetical protein